MAQRASLSISLKLILLAGIPVVGALLLGLMLARDAQQQARSTEALGTIEDLARLSAVMSDVVHALQDERAETGLELTKTAKNSVSLQQARAASDASVAALEAFLAARNIQSLPARLARDLGSALESMQLLSETRRRADSGKLALDALLERHGKITTALINATAALTQLSNDGELLRNITMLVGALEVSERMSREHALLANVFAAGQFPPGAFRELVTLVSEQQVYLDALRSRATDDQIRGLDRVLSEPAVGRVAALRKRALETDDGDEFGVNPQEWFTMERAVLSSMRRLEGNLATKVRQVASAKIAHAQTALRTSLGFSAFVLLLSSALAIWIGRGINRSVGALANAAREVRANKDYRIRAVRCSHDELGLLTDAFNEMLSDILARDEELDAHRKNLEKMVEARTQELAQRNRAMRIVLDTVEQGLVTILPDGSLGKERSRAFEAWFPDGDNQPFFEVLGPDAQSRAMLRLGWEAVIEAWMPLELTLEQLTKSITIGERHFSLAYRPVLDGEQLLGVLLIVSDISADIARMKSEATQKEFVSVFERVMKDKNGFVEFFNEASRIVDAMNTHDQLDDPSLLRLLHTLKGNSRLFGITSLADMCHEFESLAAEEGVANMRGRLTKLVGKWLDFAHRIVPLIGSSLDDIIEVRHDELQEIIDAARRLPSTVPLVEQLNRLMHEPTTVRFARAAEQAKALAQRLGKGDIQCEIDGGGVRLPRERWGHFFQLLSHVVRNAVDHGLETESERRDSGKLTPPKIVFRSRSTGGNYIIEISDDGRGIDWTRLREKAEANGLPTKAEADLTRALFADGVTTREAVTENSGRGVGMAAVAEAVQGLSGRIDVRSTPGQGTSFVFTFPVLGNDIVPIDSRFPGARPSIRPPLSMRIGVPSEA